MNWAVGSAAPDVAPYGRSALRHAPDRNCDFRHHEANHWHVDTFDPETASARPKGGRLTFAARIGIAPTDPRAGPCLAHQRPRHADGLWPYWASGMSDDVRNVNQALSKITEHWQPHRLTSVNDYDVKLAKINGEFIWHTHPDTDELFLVVSGTLTIQLRDRDVVLGPNDVFVVPKGVEHCPKSDAEVEIIMIEPKGTVNTGDAGGDMTAELRELS